MALTTTHATRHLFLASLVLFATSLVFSVTNVVTVFSAPLRAVAVPSQVGFEGYLLDATTGLPLQGNHALTFNLYSAATGCTPGGVESDACVPISAGGSFTAARVLAAR